MWCGLRTDYGIFSLFFLTVHWFVLTWNGVTSLNFLKATVTGCVCCQYDQHLHSHTWYCLLPSFDPFCRSLSFFSTPSYSVFHATASILIISAIPFFSFPILLFSLISPSFPPILLPLPPSPHFPLYFSLSLTLLFSLEPILNWWRCFRIRDLQHSQWIAYPAYCPGVKPSMLYLHRSVHIFISPVIYLFMLLV